MNSPRLLSISFAAFVTLYVCGYLLWYSGTPLGRAPVLDEREILSLAAQIAAGQLPAEPFYRAPLYPALLAVPLWLGLDPHGLPLLARLFNCLCHLASTYWVWRIAGSLWRQRAAQVISAGLVGLNPVLLHFCGDALDITCAITVMLIGIGAALAALDSPGRGLRWSGAGLAFGIGVLLRPQLLPLLAALPLVAWVTESPRRRSVCALGSLAPGVLCLGLFGAVNYSIGAEFHVLPWQGAYNFWAANRPGAHGRYFEQSIAVHTVDRAANTARLESEMLYRQQQPAQPSTPRAMSDYWQRQTLRAIADDPVRWLRLLSSKAFYLLNNVEQYNNKTYSFHRERSPWLRVNPIGWTIVFALGCVGMATHWRRPTVRALAFFAATYAAGALLYFVSDRFRAPLIPLFALASGGAITLTGVEFLRWRGAAIGVAMAAISLWPIAQAERTASYIQDEIALAHAHDALNDHGAALRWAERALTRAPSRPSVLALVCISRFNAWLHQQAEILPPDIARWRDHCTAGAAYSPTTRRILGYIEWQDGHTARARQRWMALVDEGPEERNRTLAWLLVTGPLRARDQAYLEVQRHGPEALPLLIALSWKGELEALNEFKARYPGHRIEPEFAALERLFNARNPHR